VLEHPADQIVLQEYVEAVHLGEERLVRIERAIAEFLPNLGSMRKRGALSRRWTSRGGLSPGRTARCHMITQHFPMLRRKAGGGGCPIL
jgi:hypothetical protein